MPNHTFSRRDPAQDKPNHEASQLTVENVTKLEHAYESVEEVSHESRMVEEYIRRTKQSSVNIGQNNTDSLVENSTCPAAPSAEDNGIKEDVSTDSLTKSTDSKSEFRSSAVLKGRECKTENAQTQTEWSWHDLSSANVIANGN
ncbi:Hypothetical predicted protein [Pelobates cultripes]|uniref:Uncharacterized protein n=1 Tax=Pelobates cultripes TaxID=61616 RepID=A0AAD1VN46_PELCU|nr:Hypothetical predicted protein [Pelobates cultripes]